MLVADCCIRRKASSESSALLGSFLESWPKLFEQNKPSMRRAVTSVV